jgi:hypothetical protein
MRDGARRPRGSFAVSHPGGIGAPPGLTTKPCQELADDREAYQRSLDVVLTCVRRGFAGHSRQKRGPVSASRRTWRAERRPPPPATEVVTIGLRLSARRPLRGETSS